MITAVAEATVPKFSVIVRKAYGAGLYAMCGPAFDPDACLALPTAQIAVMGPEPAVNAVFYNRIQAIEDPDERAAFVAERRRRVRGGRRPRAPRRRARRRRGRAARGPARRARPPARARRRPGARRRRQAPRRPAGLDRYTARPSHGLWRSSVSALDWGSRGRGFESRQPDSKGAGQIGVVVARAAVVYEPSKNPRGARTALRLGRAPHSITEPRETPRQDETGCDSPRRRAVDNWPRWSRASSRLATQSAPRCRRPLLKG